MLSYIPFLSISILVKDFVNNCFYEPYFQFRSFNWFPISFRLGGFISILRTLMHLYIVLGHALICFDFGSDAISVSFGVGSFPCTAKGSAMIPSMGLSQTIAPKELVITLLCLKKTTTGVCVLCKNSFDSPTDKLEKKVFRNHV